MDINGDGNRDLIGASYAGIIYLFKGTEDGGFSSNEILKDKSGENIHLGMYYDFKANKYVTVKTVKDAYKMDFAKAIDWDNDGDLDLIASGNKGMTFIINEGDKRNPVFSTTHRRLLNQHHADAFVDWDNDGLWDIIAGSKKGDVYFYKNIGNKSTPKFSEGVCLVKKEQFLDSVLESVSQSEVCVADYNGDGKPDIIIGNRSSESMKKANLTEEQKKEMNRLLKEENQLRDKMMAIINPLKEQFEGSYKRILKYLEPNEEFQNLKSKMEAIKKPLSKYVSKPKGHGYVYVCFQK